MGETKAGREYGYEQTMVCLYPHADWLVGQMRQSLDNRAIFSYRAVYGCEELVRGILEESAHCDGLQFGLECVGEALEELNELELALVRYRCWNDGRALKRYLRTAEAMSGKVLLRRYYAGIGKVARNLHSRGIDYRWFCDNVLYYDWGRRVYRKVNSPKFNKRKEARAGRSPLSKKGLNGE